MNKLQPIPPPFDLVIVPPGIGTDILTRRRSLADLPTSDNGRDIITRPKTCPVSPLNLHVVRAVQEYDSEKANRVAKDRNIIKRDGSLPRMVQFVQQRSSRDISKMCATKIFGADGGKKFQPQSVLQMIKIFLAASSLEKQTLQMALDQVSFSKKTDQNEYCADRVVNIIKPYIHERAFHVFLIDRIVHEINAHKENPQTLFREDGFAMRFCNLYQREVSVLQSILMNVKINEWNLDDDQDYVDKAEFVLDKIIEHLNKVNEEDFIRIRNIYKTIYNETSAKQIVLNTFLFRFISAAILDPVGYGLVKNGFFVTTQIVKTTRILQNLANQHEAKEINIPQNIAFAKKFILNKKTQAKAATIFELLTK